MEMEKCDPKIHIKIQETQNNQNNLENNKFFWDNDNVLWN